MLVSMTAGDAQYTERRIDCWAYNRPLFDKRLKVACSAAKLAD